MADTRRPNSEIRAAKCWTRAIQMVGNTARHTRQQRPPCETAGNRYDNDRNLTFRQTTSQIPDGRRPNPGQNSSKYRDTCRQMLDADHPHHGQLENVTHVTQTTVTQVTRSDRRSRHFRGQRPTTDAPSTLSQTVSSPRPLLGGSSRPRRRQGPTHAPRRPRAKGIRAKHQPPVMPFQGLQCCDPTGAKLEAT